MATTTDDIKQQQGRRMQALFDLARQRYLDAGGNPQKRVHCNDWLTQAELKEFSECSRNVVTDEDIANYIKKHGSWRDRFAAFKAQMQSSP